MSASPADNDSLRRAISARSGERRAGLWTRTRAGGRRILLVLGAFLVVALIIWFLRPAPESARHGGRFGTNGPVPVGTAKAALGDIRITLDALGAVTPLATVTVKPEVSGILQKVDFQEGQMVKAGDVLAEIDPRPYQAVLDQAKGALARDDAQYANAQIDLKRYQALWAQKAISQQIVATQQALVHTDAGTVQADRGTVEAAAVNLSYCKITSPVAGQVGLRQVDVGNYVQVGTTPEIVVVTQLQPMSVLFTLPEDDIAEVSERLHAGAKLLAAAYDRSQTTKIASGVLTTLDNEVDPTTGTVKLRALFDNSDHRLFPSQFVNVRLLVDTLHGQTTVPAAAVQHGPSGTYVFVVGPDRTVHMRNVGLGHADGDTVDVLRGLKAGEVVVVDGADRLRNGARVLIPGASSSGGFSRRTGNFAQGQHRRRSRVSRSGNANP
ncbi:MAG: efflux RND transporter periplasmic adaptor subunit [Rhizomicrobium sp.]